MSQQNLNSIHLFISKSIHLQENIYLLTIDMNKTSYYTLKYLNEFNTAQNGYIKCYNSFDSNLNLNNSEIMTTLYYNDKYNNFGIKSITVINNNKFVNINKKVNGYVSINKRIINNIKQSFN